MTVSMACKDTGMDCGFVAEAATREELMPKIAAHAKSVHGMETIPDDVMAKVKAAIRER